MSEMSNQNFENNSVNGTRPLGEGSSLSRWFLVKQRGPGCHQVITKMKRNKEVNKVVMERFYRSKPFDEEGKDVRGYRQRMFREWSDFLNQQSNVYVAKQMQLGKMDGYYNLNWKQLKKTSRRRISGWTWWKCYNRNRNSRKWRYGREWRYGRQWNWVSCRGKRECRGSE